jgi:hypothetical protein
MMWALKVTRSMTAATRRASAMMPPHPSEGKVAGQPDGGLLLPLREHLEQQLGVAGVGLDVADFVDQQQVETAVAGDEAGEATFVGGFDELVDELGAGGVADSASLFADGDAKFDQQMVLPVPESPSSTIGSPASR